MSGAYAGRGVLFVEASPMSKIHGGGLLVTATIQYSDIIEQEGTGEKECLAKRASHVTRVPEILAVDPGNVQRYLVLKKPFYRHALMHREGNGNQSVFRLSIRLPFRIV